MADPSGSLLVVEALYTFRGKNNDELCFTKGDLITVTQQEEGGWWEGTLGDKTGWFPSNYVRECKHQDGVPLSPQRVEGELLSPQHTQQQQIYRSLVLKDILESERAHLADMQSLLSSHLATLRKSDVLIEAEYKQMVGNLEEVVMAHSNLLTALEEQSERPSREQRIGGAFLTLAPHIQSVHQSYCSNHPRAVCILEKFKDELSNFMEGQGVPRPGIMFLTTALSKPFRRLDKYTGMLQEYQRHLEEGHQDRGDTQRSIHVYKELASVCGALRRQKELELEVVTGRVHGWDGGDSLGALGEVLRMGSVALLPDHRDRYFVMFPAVLVMLSVSPRMSAFIFEGSYHLSGIHVNRLEDGDHYKNAFELAGPVLERVVAVCQTRQDQQQWVEALTQQCRLARSSSFTPHKPLLTSPPVLPAHGGPLMPRQASATSIQDPPARPRHSAPGKVWSLSCLRPSPPLRPGLSIREDKRSQRHRRKDEKWHEDDALILRVIEAYCTSAKTRYTINSKKPSLSGAAADKPPVKTVELPVTPPVKQPRYALLDSPQVLIAEEEKIIVEETRGNQVVMEERSLVDTVYALKDQVATLLKEHQNLKKAFENEQLITRQLRSLFKQHFLGNRDDIVWDPEP